MCYVGDNKQEEINILHLVMIHMGTMLLHDVSTNTSEAKLHKNIPMHRKSEVLSRMPICDMFETSKTSI